MAVLIRLLGDIGLAEEAVQDAFTIALQRWPESGIPPAPAGWIITTARHRAIDWLRREASRETREMASIPILAESDAVEERAVEDDRLRLIFTCCHPAIAIEAQVGLTLRLLGGLKTAEIARAFLVSEPTMAQRLSRAKAKIRDAGIPYRVPDSEELSERLASVLAVVYLMFNEGYSATSGSTLVRTELCDESIRLARLLVELMPQQSEVLGLLALLLLIDARRAARVDVDGALVRLPDQDRAGWDRELIAEGHSLLRICLARNRPGPYQIQAAINAVHSEASDARHTDWAQILVLYDQLMALAPSSVVALNRAVALAEVEGPEAALGIVEALVLPQYHPLHAVRADFLRRLGRHAEAADAYQRALQHCENFRERQFLEQQHRSVTMASGREVIERQEIHRIPASPLPTSR